MSVSARCLLLFLSLTILSCGTLSPAPAPAPKPPHVDCNERRPTDPVPDAPASTDWRDWAAAFIAALGWGTQSETFRADSADCLDRHRAAGDIR